MNKRILVILISLCCTSMAMAQRASISIDALKLGLLSPNITAEILLTDRYTLNIETVMSPFNNTYNNIYTKQVKFSPELRYWFKRPMYSHFVGVNLMGSSYDMGSSDNRNKGRMVALGATYGYSIYLAPKWSLTPTVGFGCGYGENSSLEGDHFVSSGCKWKPTLTKLGFYISYIID